MNTRSTFRPILILTTLLVFLIAAVPVFANDGLDPSTNFYVVKPLHGAIEQIADLTASKDKADAALIKEMIQTPQAAWFTSGTPHQVQQSVKNVVAIAADKGTVPVLVAYNVPFRDCSQYSAGGAASKEAYEAWIDGFANGIGDREAVVILEPDGLGIIPWYTPINGAMEWCQPAEADPETAAADRFEMMNYAVDSLMAKPNVRVYLDGTHSGWLGAGDAANRLVKAGVLKASGFFLNVSNYELTDHLVKYGTWISSCIAFANDAEEGGWRLGHYDWCASQYYPANPSDFSTWDLSDAWYASNLGTAVPTAHFVIDTGRNGQGPWLPPTDHPAGDAQVWCNPPDRGVGFLPTANTGTALLDAYLWVKIPGASDGQCYRWGSGPEDPVRMMEDPAAGAWFPEMALELVQNANPPLP